MIGIHPIIIAVTPVKTVGSCNSILAVQVAVFNRKSMIDSTSF